MTPLEQARNIIAGNTAPLSGEAIPLSAAYARILSDDIFSDADYPSADRSMMDGYVIGEHETPGTFRITGEIAAGDIPRIALRKGEAIRISTGAILPENGHRVIMQEHCLRKDELLEIPDFPESTFIRPTGSEAKTGDLVLKKGSRISPTEMAILAQTGHTNPKVISIPKILHIATGSELVPPSETPPRGKIRDSNSSLISGLLSSIGLTATSHRIPDDPAAIESSVESDSDLLLISGGASVGDHDHGPAVLRKLGFKIHFDKINLRPGKPLTFATKGEKAAFVIPGNPVSHFVCFHVAIRLAIEIISGKQPSWEFLDLEISNPGLLKKNHRQTYWPAGISIENGRLSATAKPWSTSGDTFSLAATNALIRVDENPPRTLLLDLPFPTK